MKARSPLLITVLEVIPPEDRNPDATDLDIERARHALYYEVDVIDRDGWIAIAYQVVGAAGRSVFRCVREHHLPGCIWEVLVGDRWEQARPSPVGRHAHRLPSLDVRNTMERLARAGLAAKGFG